MVRTADICAEIEPINYLCGRKIAICACDNFLEIKFEGVQLPFLENGLENLGQGVHFK